MALLKINMQCALMLWSHTISLRGTNDAIRLNKGHYLV